MYPPTPAVERVVNNFLSSIQNLADSVIPTTNFNCLRNPKEAVGKIFDVKLDTGRTYRGKIVRYNPVSKLHTIDPGDLDTWPEYQPTTVDLKNFGVGESFNLVPEPFQLHFNPHTNPCNLGKRFYCADSKCFIIVKNLGILEDKLLRGRIIDQHNRDVARRYISDDSRESNARRQGVT